MIDPVVNQEFRARLRAFVRQRMGSDAETDDVVQEAMLKFVRHREDIERGSGPAWMFTVARRAIADHYRRQPPPVIALDPQDAPADPAPLTNVLDELAHCVEPLLARLSPEDRALLERVDLRGESQAQIAGALGVPRSTIKARVQRARSRFLTQLTECCELEMDPRGVPVDFTRRSSSPCTCSTPPADA